MSEPAKTPLHSWHSANGGRLVDFAGWAMPVQYRSIVNEHLATRSTVGLFDVSHMGRLFFTGPTALAALDKLVTRKVVDLKPGAIRYGLLTNDNGCALDDILVYHVPAIDQHQCVGPREAFALMVVNAGNRVKAIDWIRPRLQAEVGFADASLEYAMIAVQGPAAMSLLAQLMTPDPAVLKYYSCLRGMLEGVPVLFSRTGYTGEDGGELILPAAQAERVWQLLIDRGATACGLGSRDTLRLEAAMPLYGHELNEQTTPLEAGLDFAVTLAEREFPGSEKLRSQRSAGLSKVRIGLQIQGKRAPREHYPILASDGATVVGEVTSGSFSPTLQTSLAMGYVPPALATIGTELLVDIRGERIAARVVPLPFYVRPKS